MSDDDAFLAAIAASPDDDLPRLVYADWLDEHGRPEEARYLRLEAEFAAHPADASLLYRKMRNRLVEARCEVYPKWVDAAGRRYAIALHSCRPGRKAQTARLIDRALGIGLGRAVRLTRTAPCVVASGLPFSVADDIAHSLRYPRPEECAWALLPRPDAQAVVVPAHPEPPTAMRTRDEAIAAILAEARRLGMDADAFVRPENRGNRVLRSALRWFEVGEPLRARR